MLASILKNDNSKAANPLENVEKIVQSDAIPLLDEKALAFLKNVAKNDLSTLEFDDNLKIYSLSGAEIGTFEISVKPVFFRRQNCFKVVAKSHGLLDDAPCGTEVEAYVSESLETLEQIYHEQVQLPHGKFDRKTSTFMDHDEYIINKTETNGNATKKFIYRIKNNLMNGYISESSNILLQRLMVQNEKYESFSLFTFDSDMNPVIVSYKSLDNRIINIADKPLKIRGIERSIESISDVPTTWQIYFSDDGHMINRVQIGYPAVMKVDRAPRPIEIDEFLKRPQIDKKPLEWEKDMQLKSTHLDLKEKMKNDYDQYMHDCPELKALVADFTQSVLSFKPENTLEFAARFFASYSKKTRPDKLLIEHRVQINTTKH